MSKIQLMGSGAYDAYCLTKRVYFRPSSSTDTVRVGDLVCYNSDIVKDHKERTADPSHLGLTQDTYAEGEQEFTGRLFIVEKPATANIDFFAGVVKSLGDQAGGDGDFIEIFVPTEGAVVPVMSNIACTLNTTILAVRNGAYEASVPRHPAYPIGIAMETKDRSGTDGLVWMRFDSRNFMKGSPSGNLNIPDELTGGMQLNKIRVDNACTGGTQRLLRMEMVLEGTGGNTQFGCFQFNTKINGTVDNDCHSVSAALIFGASADFPTLPAGTNPAEGHCALYVSVEGDAGPDYTDRAIYGITFGLYLDESGGSVATLYPMNFNTENSTAQWQGLFRAGEIADLGITAQGASGQTQSWNTDDLVIPIMIGQTAYYIFASATIQAA